MGGFEDWRVFVHFSLRFFFFFSCFFFFLSSERAVAGSGAAVMLLDEYLIPHGLCEQETQIRTNTSSFIYIRW
jgi:hypothetical protein